MKTYKWILILVIFSLLVSAIGLPTKVLAAADPCPNGNGSDNSLTCSGADTNGVDGGGGNDTITVTTTGSTTQNVSGGSGDDTITNNGSVTKNITGDSIISSGNDTITNTGSVGQNISGGGGTDVIVNSGSVGRDIDGGSGTDTITNDATGTVGGSIDGGSGNDIIQNDGIVTGNISGGLPSLIPLAAGGDDQITNTGTVGGDINGGLGNDIIQNNGNVGGDINGGLGDDTITNSGTVQGSILGSLGDDTILNSGTVEGDIFAIFGDNDIDNSGTIEGNIFGGIGVNEFTNTGNVKGKIDAGASDDQVTLAGTPDSVQVGGLINGGAGTDTLNLSGLNTDDLATYNTTLAYISDPAHVVTGSFFWGTGSISWVNFEALIWAGFSYKAPTTDIQEKTIRRNRGTGSTGGIIPVTGGGVPLSCDSPFVTVLKTPLGTELTFKQLCGSSALVEDVPEQVLPGALLADLKYINSVSATLLKGENLMGALPEGSGITIDFDLPAGVDSQKLAILFWNHSTGAWVELPVAIVDGHIEAIAFAGGQFVLVTR